MFTFVGVTFVSMQEQMHYFIWRPVLRHDIVGSLLIVESKHPGYCLAFVSRESGGEWLLVYKLEDVGNESILDLISEDA